MNFKEIIYGPEYDFLRTDPRLGSRLMLLGISGSHGYGGAREGSDIDLRGVTMELPSDLLSARAVGGPLFEQYVDSQTDTVIYGFNKMAKMLTEGKVNALEVLGLDDGNYVYISPMGQELLDNRNLFLSKRIARALGEFSISQFRRMQNKQYGGMMPQQVKEEQILRSVEKMMDNLNSRLPEEYKPSTARLYIGPAQTQGLETEIFIDADFNHFPLRRFNEIVKELHSVVKNYVNVGKRNRKKDAAHLNKHCLTMLRYQMLAIDILEKGEIITHRPEAELQILRSIRDGGYMEDGIMTPDFYALVDEYDKRIKEAMERSTLPEDPDMEAVRKFIEGINLRIISK